MTSGSGSGTSARGVIRRSSRKRELPEASLNVTSLMDVLSVLLFFLLKSFSVTSSALDMPPGITLPSSPAQEELEETMSLALSAKELRVNNKVLLTLKGGKFQPEAINAEDRTLVKLKQLLDKELKKRNAIYEGADPSIIPPGKVIIMADQKLPFGTLKFLLHTAAISGYSDYQFVINHPEE
jgi:biopolymer transport protein ExbD